MSVSLYITEKPSVALEFAKALKIRAKRQDGYIESDDTIYLVCRPSNYYELSGSL